MISELFKPSCDVLISVVLGDVVNEECADSTAVVSVNIRGPGKTFRCEPFQRGGSEHGGMGVLLRGSDGSVAFLTGCGVAMNELGDADWIARERV